LLLGVELGFNFDSRGSRNQSVAGASKHLFIFDCSVKIEYALKRLLQHPPSQLLLLSLLAILYKLHCGM
jgi:hypothetical protein